MQVELAEERIYRVADRFSLEHAEGRAWAKRVEAFGALARVAGLFNQPKDDDFAVVYRERRLQPFWRVAVSTATAYERRRSYAVPVAPEVRQVAVDGRTLVAVNGAISFDGLESCREEARREVFVDGLSKQATPALAAYLQHDAVETDAQTLAKATAEGMVVVPPQAKASMVVRDVVAAAIGKIDADTVTEELVRVEAIDLYYRPIHAFRYRRADKEAVVEFDAVTGEARVGGDTFEQYLGKALEPRFLLDVGAETLNFVVPGANLAKLIIVKGMEMKGMR
ncbi:MAG: hypothetical protein C0481_14465 [Phenylobacterium sp.]|uniref:hypothetical protein n=1 Tax=Phenylobacterium sp. TaxID=1871053 RepID=UPI0025DBA2A2|nr:hypothetical protein [Phenylobacterium sp.]MBA4013066.1 hypothetical protein [Phenylobacterium sp.]